MTTFLIVAAVVLFLVGAVIAVWTYKTTRARYYDEFLNDRKLREQEHKDKKLSLH